MNKALLGGLLALAVAAAAGGGYWYGAKKAPHAVGVKAGAAGKADAAGAAAHAAKDERAVAVEVARVSVIQLPGIITAVGSLRSDESVTLRPEIAGRITEILFQEGTPVTKGETLVRLDPSINLAERSGRPVPT